jgi:hypothetical protein
MIIYSAVFCSITTSLDSSISNDKSGISSSRKIENKYNIKNFMGNKHKKRSEFKKNTQFFSNFYGISITQESEGEKYLPLFFSFQNTDINTSKHSRIYNTNLEYGNIVENKFVNYDNIENIVFGVEITQFDMLSSLYCIWTTRKLYFVSCRIRKNREVHQSENIEIGKYIYIYIYIYMFIYIYTYIYI